MKVYKDRLYITRESFHGILNVFPGLTIHRRGLRHCVICEYVPTGRNVRYSYTDPVISDLIAVSEIQQNRRGGFMLTWNKLQYDNQYTIPEYGE